ncbi:hypothetical protein ECEC4203_4897, partial [Escherichia coli EC4203]|jgi:hypothetical protein
MKF